MTSTPGPIANASSQFNVMGTRPTRHDGLEKVTGRARFGADVQMAGLLHGAMLRSPHAHARIRSIDTSKAEAAPGVKAVVTGRDFPKALPAPVVEALGNPQILSANVMARGKVLYKGQAVAAVAATSKHAAEEAAKLIRVDYEPLPPVLDVLEAMKPGAPLLHEDQIMSTRVESGDAQTKPSNIASHLQLKRGNLQQGFSEADVLVEREFRTQPVHQGYIEPQNSTAWWAPDGTLTIWKSTQGPFVVRTQVAAILAIPVSQVKVVPMEIGGGFGGKMTTYLDPVAALLSRKSGSPVKMVMSRREVFEGSGPNPGSYMRCKIGATRDGRITAGELYLAFEGGAFPGGPLAGGMNNSFAPYNLQNMQVDAYDVVVNKPKSGAYRAPGAPMAALPVESVIDEIAQKLDMDPMELRRRNATKQGDRQPSGMPFPRVGCIEVEEALSAHAHYKTPLTGPNQGRGIAMGYWGNAGMNSTATINVNSNGTVSLITGSVDLNGSRVALAMEAAEALGLRVEDVHPSVGDTDSIGWTGVSGGSRTIFATGIAVISAAEDVKRQMIGRAARIWESRPEEVDYVNGELVSRKDPKTRMTFKELAGKLMTTGGPVSATGVADPKSVGPTFAGMIVDVEVDPETGKTQVLRATVVEDAGKAAHPAYVEGQMQGAVVQGMGWALNEEYFFNTEGAMTNPSFLDYRMPTTLDVPWIETVIVEVPNPGHPFGVRGVGEAVMVPPLAAFANAVSRAIGVRVTDLPLNPGAILRALQSGGAPR